MLVRSLFYSLFTRPEDAVCSGFPKATAAAAIDCQAAPLGTPFRFLSFPFFRQSFLQKRRATAVDDIDLGVAQRWWWPILLVDDDDVCDVDVVTVQQTHS